MSCPKPVSETPSPPAALGDEAEFCVLCSRKLGFSSLLHINSPVRQEGGAYYVEGGGQVCALCAVK